MDRLVRWEQAHRTECIGVLLPTSRLQKRLYDGLDGKTRNSVQIYSSDERIMESRRPIDFSTPGIKIIAYASSKGLEFDTVFLLMLEKSRIPLDDPAFKMKFYVMASRARRNLIFHYSGEPPELLNALPLDLIEDGRV